MAGAMVKKVDAVKLLLILCVFILSQSCGKKEEAGKAPRPKSLEDFAAKVESKAQVFERKDAVEEERPLKVGMMVPMTGEECEIGRETLEGVQMAASAFNASGGVDGKPIELITMDDKGDPEAAKEALKRLVEENVIAIISSPTRLATFAPAYRSRES